MIPSFDALESKAAKIRRETILLAVRRNMGHIASSLSCVEILTTLMYGMLTEQDMFVMSKAHGWYSLYCIMVDLGLWDSTASIPGVMEKYHGNTIAFGSLGHGPSVAAGIAWARKWRGEPGDVYCLTGDGEWDEGACYEAYRFACRENLTNLRLLVDCNGYSAMRKTTPPPLQATQTWGHSVREIYYELREPLPLLKLFVTRKGEGLPFMLDDPKWHYRTPKNESEIEAFCTALNMTKEELYDSAS